MELNHVTIEVGANSNSVLVRTYKTRAVNEVASMTERLKEEARAVRDAEAAAAAAESGEPVEDSKTLKKNSKSKASVEDVDEDEDLPPLTYPPMALVFNLGDDEGKDICSFFHQIHFLSILIFCFEIF